MVNRSAGAPPLHATMNVQMRERSCRYDAEGVLVGYGQICGIYPYLPQDSYTRALKACRLLTAIVENEALRAEFLPELGGRLWRLIDKASGQNLLYTNDVIRPCNLATRNAWFSGGVEWNFGIVGHSPFTCSALHTALLEEPVQGGTMQILRMYEYERIRGLCYQMDFYLPPGARFLHCRMRIENATQQEIPMYWWSNAAVSEQADARLIVPADHAYIYLNGELEKPAIPILDGIDTSYPIRTPVARDYFYDLPEDAPRYLCYTRSGAPALLQSSTSLLRGRKLFVWGQTQGGHHWQSWLTEHAGRYCEVQSGLAKTQYGCIPMPAGACWEWIELYGAAPFQSGALPEDYGAADRYIRRSLLTLPEYAGLEGELVQTRAFAMRRGQKIADGSCFGALEQLLARQCGKESSLPQQLDFSPCTPQRQWSTDDEARPWVQLLTGQGIPDEPADKAPASYMCGERWEQLILQCTAVSGHTWWSSLQLGASAAARQDFDTAMAWLQTSVEIRQTPWALSALAELYLKQNLRAEAIDCATRALLEKPEQIGTVRDLLAILLRCGADEAVCQWGNLDDTRCKFYRACALFRLGKTEQAQRLLLEHGGLEIPDVREGESWITDLWFAIERQLAAQQGVSLPPDAQPPEKLDFRMHDGAPKLSGV